MTKEELIIGFFEKGYCCDLDEVKDTCLDLLKENQKLKAELQLYQGALKREHEAIHRVNELEEVIEKAIKRLEKGIFIIPKDTNELLDILKEVE